MISNFLESCAYDNGYQQAVLDLKNYVEKHSESFKCYKLFNYQGFITFLNAVLENQDAFMKEKEDTVFILKEENKRKKLILGE
ncbi:MAG: hypothetical protein J6S85_19540 [Methanobrevibacter sp.]|nr:hypothetical protein [Methanobrevibacter sp.]